MGRGWEKVNPNPDPVPNAHSAGAEQHLAPRQERLQPPVFRAELRLPLPAMGGPEALLHPLQLLEE